MCDKLKFMNGQFCPYFQFFLSLNEHVIDNAGLYGMLSYNNISITFSLHSASNTFEADCQFPNQPFK